MIKYCKYGGVAEWLKTQHWKCCNGLRRSWVRIPSLPPPINDKVDTMKTAVILRFFVFYVIKFSPFLVDFALDTKENPCYITKRQIS